MQKPRAPHRQSGTILLDALIAIVIFSIGILGMVKLQGQAVCSSGVGGYHENTSAGGKEVAYAVVPQCGSIDEVTLSEVRAEGGEVALIGMWKTSPAKEIVMTPFTIVSRNGKTSMATTARSRYSSGTTC